MIHVDRGGLPYYKYMYMYLFNLTRDLTEQALKRVLVKNCEKRVVPLQLLKFDWIKVSHK